jgi:hypothetical protein
MKLIKELNEQVEFLTEEKDGKKQLYIEGVFLQADIVNRNRRLYPKAIMEKEVERYDKEYIQERRAYGEMGHPEGPTINPDRISHRIVSLKEQGTNYIGKALISNSPMGQIAKALMDEGGKLGVSSRALGSMKVNEDSGINEVQADFMLATAADIVIDPSAPDAFVNGIMENVDWICESGVWKRMQIEQAQKIIRETPKRNLLEAKLAIFEKFLKNL